ncbi:YihY/virulence factor BrkB family protein, partial [Brevundimonas naejangsanensis]
MNDLLKSNRRRSGRRPSRPSAKGAGGLLRYLAAAAGGLATGATAAHLLYTQGYRFGLELRPPRPEALPPPDPTP